MCKRAIAGLYVVLFATLSLFATSAPAASTIAGIVDPSLGQGTLTDDLSSGNDRAQGVAIQADGKIVVVGYATSSSTNKDFAVVRYDSKGVRDTTFGNNGLVTTDFEGADDLAEAVAIQADGKIVVAGFASINGSGQDFAIARYNSDGSLDKSFHNSGTNTTAISSGSGNDKGTALALQLDGKIVVGGYTNNGSATEFAMVRYNTDGTLDGSFGNNGITTTTFNNGNDDEAYSVAVQRDGRIVMAGFTAIQTISPNNTKHAFAIARYTSNGSLDSTGFSSGGIVTDTLNSAFDEFYALAIQPDGKILAAGRTKDPATTTATVFAVGRYTASGGRDSTFGTNGFTTTRIRSGVSYDRAQAIALQPDGKIVVAGFSIVSTTTSMALTRYNSDGSLDADFGGNNGDDPGTVVLNFNSSSSNEAHALALQPDGKIVVAGFTDSGSTGEDFAVARLYAANGTWGLTPSSSIGFTDVFAAPPGSSGSTSTSALITISGLGTATCGSGTSDCVDVPVNVSKGRYQKGAGTYTTGLGWARNGDQFSVQQDIPANAKYGDVISTTLTMGGLVAANNYGVVLCPLQSTGCPTRYTFTTTVDNQPRISGAPATTVEAGSAYSFAPTASDPDAADALTFSIQNRPLWASFDPATGALTGTPANVDIGANADIRISVTDSLGQSTSLPAFTINVTGIQSGTGTGGGTGASGGGPIGPAALAALALGVLLRRERRTGGGQTAASTSLGSA